jgi:hypothetical protein
MIDRSHETDIKAIAKYVEVKVKKLPLRALYTLASHFKALI